MPGGDVLISRLLTAVVVDLGQSESSLRQHKQSLQEAESSGKQFGQSQAEIGEKATQLRAKLIELNSELAGLRGRLRDLESQNANVNGMLTPNIEQTRTEMAKLQGAISDTRGELRDLGKSADDSGKGFLSGASAIGKYFTVLIAMEVAVKTIRDQVQAFAEFDQAMARTAALTNTTRQEIAEMTPAIRQLSVETGRPLTELGQALYFIESSGIKGAAGLDILRASAQASAIGMGTSTDVAKLLTQAINTYGLQASDAGKLMDALTVAVREGSGEASDYARNIGTVLPIAEALGINFQQVVGSLSVMSLAENNAARNATALRQVLQELIAPGAEAQKALAGVGLTADQLRQMVAERGLPAALLELKARTHDNIDELEKIFPDIRAFTGYLRLTQEQADKYVDVVRQASTETGTFAGAVQVGGENAATAGEKMGAAFSNVGTALGEKLAPFIVPVATEISTRLTPAVDGSGKSAETAAGKWDAYSAAVKKAFDILAIGPGLVGQAAGVVAGSIQQAVQGLSQGVADANRALTDLQRQNEADSQQRAMGYDPLNPHLRTQAQETAIHDASARQNDLIAQLYAGAAQAATTGSQQEADAFAQGGDRVQAALEASLDFNRARTLIGTNGQKLLDAFDEFVTKDFDKGGQQALEKAAALKETLEHAWRDSLDPAVAQRQIAQLDALFGQLGEGLSAEAKAAIEAQIRGLLTSFGQAAEDKRVQEQGDKIARQAKAAADARQRQAEQQAREAQDRLVNGLTADIEARRPEIEAAYGRAGDTALSTFVSALSGARSGKTTEPILQAQAKLAEQLRTAGVVDWQAAADRVGQAYLDALSGKISGTEAANVLAGAIAEIPKLSPETFLRGLDRQALLSLGGNAGKGLAEGIEAGFREGGQKSITQVQQNAVAMLRETEKITNPELAERRAYELMQAIGTAVREGTPEAIHALEEFGAQWNRQIALDVARQTMVANIHKAAVEESKAITEANAEASRQIGEVVRGVGEERGTAGLESFRQHMRSALGEQTDLFKQVSAAIDDEQAKLGGAEGFRAARENFQRLMDDRLRGFQEEQYGEQVVFQEGEERKRRELQHTREEEDANRRHSREDAQLALGQLREGQDLTRRRQREDADAVRQLNRELQQAQARGASPQELADIRSRASESESDRARQRGFEDEDSRIARERAQQDLALRRGQEEADRNLARGREAQDVQEQHDARQRQHEFELGQARDLQREQRAIAAETTRFEDEQSDARLGHQLRNIEAERGKRVQEARDTFAELRTEQEKHFQEVETQVNRPAWRAMLQGFIEEFGDPAQQIVDRLVASAVAGNGVSGPAGTAVNSILAATQARDQVATLQRPTPQTAPLDVRLQPDQIEDLKDMQDRPIQMDGEDVESVQSQIRRNRNRGRSLG